MRRALVTGASGLLGGAVLRDLRAAGIETEGWSHVVASAPDGVAFRAIELKDPDAVEAAMADWVPDLVIHCAALTDVDRCEADPAAAQALNAQAPGRLAAAARGHGARFVHISTDAVYDGERPGRHAETDPPAPVNAYARSKLDGEHAVLAAHPGALVVRTTIHGWTARGRHSFSESILRGLMAGSRLRLFADVRFSVVNVVELAAILRELAVRGASGVVNAGAADALTKEQFGRAVAGEFGLDDAPIEAISLRELGLPARRPRNCSLDVSRVTALLGASPPTVRDGVRRLFADAADGIAARLKGVASGDLARLVTDPKP